MRHHYATKLGMNAIPERMDARLQKTVQHYMTEVSRIQGANKPVQTLNQEVLREASSSMDAWLRKQESAASPTTTSVGAFSKPEEYSKLFEDPSTRYESMMAERAPPAAAVPSVPDFLQPRDMLESTEDPVVLMQKIQKQREEQSRALGIPVGSSSSSAPAPAPAPAPTPTAHAPRLEIRENAAPSATQPVPPQAEAPPPLLAPRPQDYIIPQEDIVKFRETEYNIFLTSSDRDWLRNHSENRYNFSVNFNTGTKKSGFSYNTALQERFRNIQRIEFVKAIVPIESLVTLPRVKSNDYALNVVYDTARVVNVFALPFAGVRIAELNNNGFSTKPEEDNTFAIVQYDTTWSSDLLAPTKDETPVPALTKSGYTGLIPKFLKTQKVYAPTPLATLQRLSIRLERHSGDLLSPDSDVLFLSRICMSSHYEPAIGTMGSSIYNVGDPQNSYIFIKTKKYFPFSAVSEGDNIQIQGYAPAANEVAAADFTTFINRAAGHYVVATAYVDAAGIVQDGRNNAGYCNVIIIRSRFDDPTTGLVGRSNSYFGGSASEELAFANCLSHINEEPEQTGAALLNISRQTHIVLRVITRDFDSASNIRPDNV